jgi:hypothetical protein
MRCVLFQERGRLIPTVFQEYFGGLKHIKSFGRLGAVYLTPDDNLVFCKTVVRGTTDHPRHFMWKSRSWGISLGVVSELNEMEVDEIALDIVNEGPVHVDMATFNRKSIIERYQSYEEQCFLHERYWNGDWT